MIVILGVLNIALYAGTQKQDYYPPIPLVVVSVGSYEQWVAYYYSNEYLSATQYIISQSTYNQMIKYVSDSMIKSRTLTFDVYGYNTTIMTNTNVQFFGLDVYPYLTLIVHVYILQQQASFYQVYQVQIPIRYYIVENLMTAVLTTGPNATREQVINAVSRELAELKGVYADVVISDYDNLSRVSLNVRDCYLVVFYPTCPIYADQATTREQLPNLTFGLSTPT
jgi:hypothetical protein